MARRAIPVGLVIAAAAADGAGAHGLAFYALLLAVPAAAVAALEAFGHVLDGAGEHLHALLWTVVLALVVVGAAVRAPAVTDGGVPALGRSALLACLAVFCVQAVVAATQEFRSR
ncbi:MAG TPA: hypothetical protein VE055_06015 [Gaiellaceae bacterium]|jgi:hypothetical protein|nr:hypothetical protein [Gaiellaceae bacterium]